MNDENPKPVRLINVNITRIKSTILFSSFVCSTKFSRHKAIIYNDTGGNTQLSQVDRFRHLVGKD